MNVSSTVLLVDPTERQQDEQNSWRPEKRGLQQNARAKQLICKLDSICRTMTVDYMSASTSAVRDML